MPIIPRQKNNSIPQVTQNPVDPQPGDAWILATGLVGKPGLAMGPLGLTYTHAVANHYSLVMRTQENINVGMVAKDY